MSRILNQMDWEQVKAFAPSYPNEAAVQRDGNEYLREHGFDVRVFASDKSKRRQESGWFDAVAVRRGWMLLIEYKAPGGRLREKQEELHAIWRPHLNSQTMIIVADHPLIIVSAVTECDRMEV